MIYISLTDGSIIKYCINCVPTLVETIQVVPSYVIADNPDLSYLDRLQLNEDHLLAGGYTGLYKVPLQTCTSLGEDYNLCVGDPMCYYNSSKFGNLFLFHFIMLENCEIILLLFVFFISNWISIK